MGFVEIGDISTCTEATFRGVVFAIKKQKSFHNFLTKNQARTEKAQTMCNMQYRLKNKGIVYTNVHCRERILSANELFSRKVIRVSS